ncbi:hypothetical protein QJQ45_010441 [Haematococcus lacustris]|nr:hypothetical protein QJQ45_010441 [Haematococcus lacustris]
MRYHHNWQGCDYTGNAGNSFTGLSGTARAVTIRGAYVRRLEAACHLLHQGIERATGAQPASSCPHKAAPPAATPSPANTDSITAGELCTLLLTDQEVLDVVLALHDIRAAQLCHLLSWPGSHALKLPPPSEALVQQLSQSQLSVLGSQLLSFVKALERDHDISPKGDPLLHVWDSMHRAMLLVLAALQSLPIRSDPQHPDPAAITHTSTTTQLPPGYHRCSACLLVSLRLAICLAHHCVGQNPNIDLALARLHGTLPGLLLGLSMSVTAMQAAGHPEAQAQRVQFVRCLLHLGPLVTFNMYEDFTCFGHDPLAWLLGKVTPSCSHKLARLLASSSAVTGWPGPLPAKPSPMDSHTAKDSPGLSRNSGRLNSNRGTSLGPLPASPSASSSSLLCVILNVLPRSLVVFQACIAAARLAVTTRSVACYASFPGCIRIFYAALCRALELMVQRWPDQRCRPAMLRVMARSAAAGAHAYTALALLLGGAPDHGSETRSLSGLARTPELEQNFSTMITRVCHMWILLLAPPGRSELLLGTSFILSNGRCGIANDNANDMQKELHQPSSAQQLAPLALDLVFGMEGMLQMTQQHWRMFPQMVTKEIGLSTFSFYGACDMSLVLIGHVIELLATPSVVGPAGLAAQPASWLPCGNSLLEGWCSQLLDRVCQIFWITSPALEGPLDHTRIGGCQVLAGSHNLLLQGRQPAPPSMSPEAERLLACMTLVLTVALPLDTWLAAVASMPADEVVVVEQAMHDLLTQVEAEQVWSWQALAAGTPAEASLASVLQGAANKLQLPHLRWSSTTESLEALPEAEAERFAAGVRRFDFDAGMAPYLHGLDHEASSGRAVVGLH